MVQTITVIKAAIAPGQYVIPWSSALHQSRSEAPKPFSHSETVFMVVAPSAFLHHVNDFAADASRFRGCYDFGHRRDGLRKLLPPLLADFDLIL